MDPTDGSLRLEPAPGLAYSLERELGRGGMATVYLARDRKHDRAVAVKVLHADLAAVVGAERFLAEIRVTARLQHPHILGLIDSGVLGPETGAADALAAGLAGRPYYVMPYVEGESLRARLTREGPLPVADALRIAREVASALDYAHRHGVVHRDVKPENILLGDDGQALVADFGIALAVAQAGGARLTQTGLSLGTPAYMAPEQAMGERQIEARADVYALGAVLYELLAGEPPFTGPSAQAIVARLMTEEPRSLAAQRRSVPPGVDAAVHRALERLPADRFASAAEFGQALERAADERGPLTPTSASSTDADGRARSAAGRGGRVADDATVLRDPAAAGARVLRVPAGAIRFVAGGLAAVALLGAGWVAAQRWGAGHSGATPPPAVLRSTLLPPPGDAFAGGDGLALSADGTLLAFTVLRGAPLPRLVVRTLTTGAGRELPGTADAHFPFWSPDGRTLGFFAGGELRVVPMAGGPVTAVAHAPAPTGGAWISDGTILFGGGPGGVIYRVRPGGGPPVPVTRRGVEGPHERPVLLPDGHRFLFSGQHRSGIFLGDLRTGEQRRLRPDGDAATFASPDHLLFEAAGTAGYGRLMAQPFDPGRGAVDGDPVLVADSVARPGDIVGYTAAAGLLVYQERLKASRVWVDREGVARDSIPDDDAWTFRLAHDGSRVAQAGIGLWVRDLRRGVALRVAVDTVPGRAVMFPVWAPDDRRLAFITHEPRGWPLEIRVVHADGTGVEERLPAPRNGGYPLDWSPDGTRVLLSGLASPAATRQSLWLVHVTTRALTPWLVVPGSIPAARFSPDGRWVAYQSDETGSPEVYLRPFPGPGAPARVSPAGGGRPAWRADGQELFYLTSAGDLVGVPVRLSGAAGVPDIGVPRVLVRGATHDAYARLTVPYDASPDGQRFLLNAENRIAPPLTVLAPWPLVRGREGR